MNSTARRAVLALCFSMSLLSGVSDLSTAAAESEVARSNELRPAFPDSDQVSADDKARIYYLEVRNKMQEALYQLRRGQPVDVDELVSGTLEYARQPQVRQGSVKSLADFLFSIMAKKEISAQEERKVIDALSASPNVELQSSMEGRERVFALRSQPLALRLKTFDGREVTLESLRGKVVLVDVWANSCSVCINAMPHIQSVYDKYRDRGFTVVGVWLGGETIANDLASQQVKAKDILKKQGVTWPNGVLTGKELEDFRQKYAVGGLPVTWLLDRQGLLAGFGRDKQTLEQTVRSMLESADKAP